MVGLAGVGEGKSQTVSNLQDRLLDGDVRIGERVTSYKDCRLVIV